tara:strand:+ start:1019 stop:1294 length:276 start_codon:yes stop_codon:yes gene_type:complete
MSETKKFTEEELNEVTKLKEDSVQKIQEFGQIELEILMATQRLEMLANAKTKAQEEYVSLQDREKELVEKLNKKYGSGQLDIASGEFKPTK